MTVISYAVESAVQTTLDTAWDSRDGTVVPKTEDVKLKDGPAAQVQGNVA